jgi:hypothetical protein
MTKLRLWLLLFAVLFIALPTGKAFAHAELQESSPAAGATLSEPVKEITATFSENIQPMSTLTVVDQANKQVKPDHIEVAGKKLTAAFSKALEQGAYTVQWQNVADDGHASKGSFTFTVGTGTQGGSTTGATNGATGSTTGNALGNRAGAASGSGSGTVGGASDAAGATGTAAGASGTSAVVTQGQSGIKRYAPAIAIVVVCLLVALTFLFFIPKRKQGKRD